MKTYRLTILCILASVSMMMAAQKPAIYLFDNFTQGKVYLKGHGTSSSKFNYDAANHKLLYWQNGNTMELTDNTNIDSLVIADRLFIPYKQRFVEYVPVAGSQFLLIDWTLTEQFTGARRGAMGQLTQANVQAVNVGALYARTPNEDINSAIDEYEKRPQNTYIYYFHGKSASFRNNKSFLKSLPASKDEMKAFLNDKHLNVEQPDDAIKAIEHFFTLQ